MSSDKRATVRALVCECDVQETVGMLNTLSTLLMVTGVRNGCLRGFRLSPSHFKLFAAAAQTDFTALA